MPNRIIKESICTSDKVSALTDFEFRLWVGLLVSVDDAGRGDARPAIIKGRVFPLRERVSVKDIDAALHGLAAKGCVSLYTVGGKPYFWFPTWAAHQRIRDSKPKYPSPDENDSSPQVAASCGELPLESNTIQSEYKSESNTYSPAGEVAELFNSICKALPKVTKMTDARKKKIRICAEKIDNAWELLFQKTEASDFLTGKDGEWRATFDWIIDKDHPIKILEGNYDNRSELGGRIQHKGLDDMATLAMQRLQNGGAG